VTLLREETIKNFEAASGTFPAAPIFTLCISAACRLIGLEPNFRASANAHHLARHGRVCGKPRFFYGFYLLLFLSSVQIQKRKLMVSGFLLMWPRSIFWAVRY